MRCCRCLPQVRCIYSRHFSLIYTGMSFFLFILIWNVLRGRFFIRIHSDEIYDYVPLAFAIWDGQAFSPKISWLRFEHRALLFICFCISRMLQNSGVNVQKQGYLWCLHGSVHQENISGFYLTGLLNNHFHSIGARLGGRLHRAMHYYSDMTLSLSF